MTQRSEVRAGRALLLVDHGSRAGEANAVIEEAARALRQARPDWVIEIAHMEIATPDIPAGLEACAAAGAREIIVQPWFLGPGRHIRETIPNAVAEAAAQHPDLAIRVVEPFGPDPKLIEIVLERAEASHREAGV